MKQSLVVALLLGALCNASFAVILFGIEAPQDEAVARGWAGSLPELKPLHAAYTNLIQTRLWPLKFSKMAKISARSSKPPRTGGGRARMDLANILVRASAIVPQIVFCRCSLLDGAEV